MKTCRVRVYGKVNMFLDVVGKTENYHSLDSVVCTINVFDDVIITSRKDEKIVLRTGGGLYSVSDSFDNNAYKAASAFSERFHTRGVDILLRKNIPVGGGLGGSSADIAGVLTAMKRLYGVDEDIKPLADSLGSDSGYLLTGGYARLCGRGEIVTPLDIKTKLYLVVVPAKGGCNTSECFKNYDASPLEPIEGGAEKIIRDLSNGTIDGKDFYNALYAAACVVNPAIKENFEALTDLSPTAVFMSGSGSCVCAAYPTPELCLWALDKIKRKHRDAFVTETLSADELKPSSFFTRSLYSSEAK